LVNEAKATDFAIEAAKDTVGDAQVINPVPRTLGTEDFAYYLQHKPGNYMAIGTGKPGAKEYNDIHSAKYDFNDAALPIGASYWANLVEKKLPLLTPPAANDDGTLAPSALPPAGPKP
jgi:hippurate hydrolase